MKKNILASLALLLLSLMVSFNANAQVTTSAIAGIVVDVNDEPLPAANIVARHTTTGTVYGISTRVDGRYTLPNLRIGGPYEITVSYIGFQPQVLNDVFLVLGETSEFNFVLSEDVQSLGEVVVSTNSDINPGRTGAATSIDNATLKVIPTISRSASDIYKLNPASDGNSFAGRNDQYNNFSLDGSIFNNPFGLDAATPGGQANAQPISLDAIDQIIVSLAPYDVTQSGFTGASVNAVTKSGTNTFTGTAYSFYRNQDLTGSQVSGNDIFVPDLTQLQTGFSIGGPIIKDKLFFFANFEAERREDLGSNFIPARAGLTGDNVSRVTAADLETVSNLLSSKFGYETGAYEGFLRNTDSNKGLFKLDWNVNQNHSVTATFNFLDAYRDLNANPDAIGRRGPDAITLQFANSGYRINNDIFSGIVEVKSIFGNKFSNKFQAGYTYFDDSRDPFSDPFPVLNINQNGVRYIVAGHEPFSINNKLDQKVYQVTNNFDMYLGAHMITIGASFERFDFDNSFNLAAYDPFGFVGGTFGPGFESVQAFVDFVNAGNLDAAVDGARSIAAADNWALAELTLGQTALYVQDKWYINDNLNLTLGLRVDMPLYFDTKDKLQENIDRKGGLTADGGTYSPEIVYYDENDNPVTFDHTVLPDNTPLFSPRFGFNYDVYGDESFQLRGGSGLFTGRFPFVWIGNQVANPDFYFYNVTSPDFKYPQVWRTNFGIDKVLKNKVTISSDFVYTKDINAMLVRNYGLRAPSETLTGADNRPYYLGGNTDRAQGPFGGPTNAYVYTNTDDGYSINWSLEAKKMYDNGMYATLGYAFLKTETVSSNTREISSDIFDGNPIVVDPNNPRVSNAIYGNRHRIIGTMNKTWTYGDADKWSTTVSLFYEAAQGGRFSYTYAGDANGDGSFLNDLIYIPTPDELQTYQFSGNAQQHEAQRNAFENYISQDTYLKDRRGQYAERYANLSPWFSRLDIRVLQDLNLMGNQSVQFSMDILNFGNLFNNSWGVREGVNNTQPISIAVDPATQIPTYTFDESQTSSFVDDFSLNSRWQIQFGIRYNF